MCRQEEVDSFITLLYHLAEHCNYRDLHNEMIRDQVGLRDAGLSEWLQTDSELTLNKAITMVQQTEKQMSKILNGLGVVCMIDDVLAHGKTPQEWSEIGGSLG